MESVDFYIRISWCDCETVTEQKWGSAAHHYQQANAGGRDGEKGKRSLFKCSMIWEGIFLSPGSLGSSLLQNAGKSQPSAARPKPKTVPRIPVPSFSVLWRPRLGGCLALGSLLEAACISGAAIGHVALAPEGSCKRTGQ